MNNVDVTDDIVHTSNDTRPECSSNISVSGNCHNHSLDKSN